MAKPTPQPGPPLGLRLKMIRTAIFDLRYGGLLHGYQRTRYSHLGANDVSNSNYSALPHLFLGRIEEDDVLVDVGCGKGRVINWWLSRGFNNRIIGIELDPEIANKTRSRLRRYVNVEILAGNAIENLPSEGTLFYIFNSFQPDVVRAFKDRLASVSHPLGNVRIIYHNCKHIDVFEGDPNWTIEGFAARRQDGLYNYAVITLQTH